MLRFMGPVTPRPPAPKVPLTRDERRAILTLRRSYGHSSYYRPNGINNWNRSGRIHLHNLGVNLMIKLTGKFKVGEKTSTRNFDKINAEEWTQNNGRVFLNKYKALLQQGSAIVNGKITRYTEEEVELE